MSSGLSEICLRWYDHRPGAKSERDLSARSVKNADPLLVGAEALVNLGYHQDPGTAK